MQPCPLCLFPLYLACICLLNFLSSQNRDPGQFTATQTGLILAAKSCPRDQFSLPILALLGPLLLQPKSARGTHHLCVGPVLRDSHSTMISTPQLSLYKIPLYTWRPNKSVVPSLLPLLLLLLVTSASSSSL